MPPSPQPSSQRSASPHPAPAQTSLAQTSPAQAPPTPVASPAQATPAPAASPSERVPWRDTFASLRILNFRLFTAAHLVAVVAIWMQRIAQDWLVLELSGSVTAVGITTAFQFLPTLLLGPLGGIIADRHSKRILLMVSQSAAAVLALALAVLALTGAVQVWHVYLVALALGMVTVIDQPARQVFVHEMVGPKHLRNALSVSSSVFQLGAMVGPAVAGVMIGAVGGGWAFAINAAACSFTVFMLGRLRTDQLFRTEPAPRTKGMLREGARYARTTPTVFWPMAMCAFVSVFALSTPVLMAAFADEVFHSGANGFGLLNTLVATGALAGAVASTRRRTLRLRTVIVSAATFAIALAASAFSPSLPVFGAVMIVAGFCSMQFITSANQLVQSTTAVVIRGRVMSLYIMVLIGGQAVGGPLTGWLAEVLEPQGAIFVAGAVPALAAAVIGLILARQGNLRLRLPSRLRLRSPLRPRGIAESRRQQA
ncbi:MFS transporter [Arthrobacter sp. G119Y2]|uniref:MFS transporter n=1 Tax=Arthrobacter sp. G119Y2 TaxID=3134965 RepID=UPI0031195198